MGKDNEYLPLKDKCFEKRFQGYNYNFCFYGSAKQDSNNLGSWDGLEVDATAGTTKAMFKNGASCWNGPSRSLHVMLECGSENDILDVYEPSMCEYHEIFDARKLLRIVVWGLIFLHCSVSCSNFIISYILNDE